MSKLKKLNKLNKSKTLNVALAVGLVASNLVAVVPAFAATPASSHVMTTSNSVKATTSTLVNTLDAKDVKVTVSTGNDLATIKLGTYTLVEGTDYTKDGAVVTISASYLKGLSNGTKNLKFHFAGGSDKSLTIKITNKNATIAAKYATFSNKNDNGKAVSVTVQANGLTLAGIKNGTTALSDDDYVVGTPSSSGTLKVTISADYLKTLAVGSYKLDFDFDGCDTTPYTTIKVTNNEVVNVTVKSVSPVTVTTTVGTQPELPATVEATMSDGSKKQVAVTWGTVDVSKAGTVTVEGTIANSTVKATATVTVKAAALAVNSVSAINNTTITATLAAGSDATKAADKASYTVMVGTVAIPVTNVVYVDGTKVATLTVNMVEQEGTLTVNGTASATAVDYKKPTITTVTPISTKQIEVTFSEKIDATTATNPANYGLYPLNAAGAALTWLTTDTGAAAGAGQITALVSKTADNKVVITLGDVDTAVSGYVLDGLTNSTYMLYVKNVQDAATNAIVTNSNSQFTGTTNPDATAPNLTSATYNVGTGVLGLALDKTVKVDTAKVVASKISITNGTTTVALTAADTVNGTTGAPSTLVGVYKADGNTQAGTGVVDTGLKIRLTTATKALVDALGSTNLSVVLAEGALVDASAENPVAAKTQALTTTLVPLVNAAEYNEATNVLKLTFNMPIDVSKIAALTGITINGANAVTGTTVKTTSNSNVVELQLSATQAATVETAGTPIRTNTVTQTAVVVPAGLFTKVGATALDPGTNVATTIAQATVVQDTVAPTVTANIKGLNGAGAGVLTLTASEELDSTIVPANIKLYTSDNMTTPIGVLPGATTITRVGTTLDYTHSLGALDGAALNAAIAAHKTIVMTVDAGAIKDINLTDIAAVATTAPITVSVAEGTYGNAVTNAVVAFQSASLVTLGFTDGTNDVQLDKTIADVASNYEFTSVANPNLKIAVSKATYTWNATAATGKLDLVPATAIPTGDFKLTLTGIKTNAGLAVEEVVGSKVVSFDGTDQSDTVNGVTNNPAVISITADSTSPTLLAANGAVANSDGAIVLTDGGTLGQIGSGDTITLEFSEPMKLTNATAADFTVTQGSAASTGSLGSATVSLDPANASKVIITLASNSTLKIGNDIVVNATAHITDLAGNQVDVTGANAKVTTDDLAVPGGLVAPVITRAVYADANNDGAVSIGDKLVLTFDQDLVEDATNPISGLVASDFDLTTNGSLATFTPVKTGAREVTLTFLTKPNFNVAATKNWMTQTADAMQISVKAAGAVPEIQNAWGEQAQGNGLTAADVDITTADVTAPSVTGISYKAATHTLTLTLSEKVSFNETASTGNPSLLAAAIFAKMTSDAGSSLGAVADDTGVAYAKDASNNDILNQITLTLTGEAIDSATKIDLTAGGFATGSNAEVVSDAAGNLAQRAQYENAVTIIQ